MNSKIASILAKEVTPTGVALMIESICNEALEKDKYNYLDFENRITDILTDANSNNIKTINDIDPDKVEFCIKKEYGYSCTITSAEKITIRYIDNIRGIVRGSAICKAIGYFKNKDDVENGKTYNSHNEYSIDNPYKLEFVKEINFEFNITDDIWNE